MCSLRALDSGETRLSVEQRKLSEGAGAFEACDVDHAFVVQISDFDGLALVQDAEDVIFELLDLLIGGRNGESWTAFLLLFLVFGWTLFLLLLLLDVDLVS